MQIKKKQSFTLIELLIVIAIIAIISSIVGINYSASQKRARDTQRIADMNIIASALNSYRREKGGFPNEVSTTLWEESKDNPQFLEYLKTYIANIPFDPKNTGSYYYAYRYYNNGSGSCLDENQDHPFFVLAIKTMEVEKNKFKERAICNGYDWGNQFDYSIKIMQ